MPRPLPTSALLGPERFRPRFLSPLLIALALLTAPLAASAMTADELIAKNLEARGGLEKLRAVSSMHMLGKFQLGGGAEAKTEAFMIGPNKIRFEFSLQGLTQVSAWDGSQGWAIDPFRGRREPQKLSAEDIKSLIVAADIAGPLVDWKAKGSKVEYLGTEDIDGTDAHKLRVTFKNGDSQVLFIDPDHFLEIRTEDHQFVRGQEQIGTTDLGEYALVDGVYFPFEQGRNHIESMEVNKPVDAAMFAFPTKP